MLIIETSIFTRQVKALLQDDEYRLLQLHLAGDPDCGAVIKGAGGLRKVRWSTRQARQSLSGSAENPSKNSGGRVPMKDELFSELVASLREGGTILQGKAAPARAFEVEIPEVRQIRAAHDLSQAEFAALLGISVDTLQNWEQGRRTPAGPARILLQVVAKHPEAVWDVVKPRRTA